MAKYLMAYHGGEMAQTDEQRAAVMAAWGAWFGALGSAIVDPGNPCGPAMTVAGDGSIAPGGSSALTGYSVISADSLQAASELAKGCPVLGAGGSVEVYEVHEVM